MQIHSTEIPFYHQRLSFPSVTQQKLNEQQPKKKKEKDRNWHFLKHPAKRPSPCSSLPRIHSRVPSFILTLMNRRRARGSSQVNLWPLAHSRVLFQNRGAFVRTTERKRFGVFLLSTKHVACVSSCLMLSYMP